MPLYPIGVPLTRAVTATAPLAGGGSLSSDISISLSIGTGLQNDGGTLKTDGLTHNIDDTDIASVVAAEKTIHVVNGVITEIS
jgi:hypothetical protein